MKYLHTSFKDHVYTIVIDNQLTLNALNSEILDEMQEQIDRIGEHGEIRAVIITGAGRSFVAGADISEMAGKNCEEGRLFGKLGARLFRAIEQLPMPVIAAVNGFALGGGCELAMACDIRIASDKAKFAQPEVTLGITPGFSATARLPRLVGPGMAKLLICSGRTIDAAEALRIGLVEMVVAVDEFEAKVRETAEAIAKNAPVAVQASKKLINEGLDMTVEESIGREIELFGDCFATQDQKDGMNAFMSKTKAQFSGK